MIVYVLYDDYGPYKGCGDPLAVMTDLSEVEKYVNENKYLTYQVFELNDTVFLEQ